MSCEVPKELKAFGKMIGWVMERITAIANAYNIHVSDNPQSKEVLQTMYSEIEELSENILETGIGDWIRGTKMWNEFQNETSALFSAVIDSIRKENRD